MDGQAIDSGAKGSLNRRFGTLLPMRPEDLPRFATLSDPRIHPDGVRVAFVVSRMNLEDDRYDRQIWIWDGSEARPFTHGPGDGRPRWSPDGSRLAFIRTGPAKDDRPQVAVMSATGGEAVTVTEFALGASEAEWSPAGSHLACVGAEWKAEWTDLEDEERGRIARRIDRFGYRFDDAGYLFDKTTNVYLVDASGGVPVRLTTGEYRNAGVAWRPDGNAIGFISARHERRFMDSSYQPFEVSVEGGDEEAILDLGFWADLSYGPDGTPYLLGMPDATAYPDIVRVWRVTADGPVEIASDIDRNFAPPNPPVSPAGPQWIGPDRFMSLLEDRGRIRAVTVDADGTVSDLIGGDRLITGASPRPDGSAVAFVATTPTDPGELIWWENGEELVLTSINADFRAEVPLVDPIAFTAMSDDEEIDAWVLLPEGSEAVPMLLNIHGGPATQFGYGFFDEFQVYVGAGYGVVACNPRGSSGRGRDFVRTPVQRWHEDRSPDLRDILEVVETAFGRFDRLDRDRMGIMGGSYGGFMTVKILGVDEDRWRSAVPVRWGSCTKSSRGFM